MKTYKNLYEKYISDENISLSVKTAMRGDKAKRTKEKLKYIYSHLDVWIPKLRNIANNFYNHKHTPKEIYDGITRKKRTIIVPSVVELIIQHMQINILKPIFMHSIYKHTYASVNGRGAHEGKKYISKWLKKDPKNTKYCLQIDIKHFFESVNIDILKKKLSTIIKDERFLSAIFKIIDVKEANGLPLGFYTSQWYTNFYLQQFDHYAKEQLHIKYYARYMDDMIFLSGNKRKLRKILKEIKTYLSNTLSLTLKDNYSIFYIGVDKSNFIDFMGFRFYRNRTTLRRSIMLKSTRKAKRITKKNNITVHDSRQMLAYSGLLKASDTYNMYLDYIKPYVNFKTLKKIISRYDKKQNRKELKLCGTKHTAPKDLKCQTLHQVKSITMLAETSEKNNLMTE